MRKSGLKVLLTSTLFALCGPLMAADFSRTELPEGHPMIGIWKIAVPGTTCSEMYDIRADGTMRVTSGAQVVETEFSLSREPAAGGFYSWTDHILKENGQADCLGNTHSVGHQATHFITVHREGNQFLMCQQQNLETCVGPFTREEGI